MQLQHEKVRVSDCGHQQPATNPWFASSKPTICPWFPFFPNDFETLWIFLITFSVVSCVWDGVRASRTSSLQSSATLMKHPPHLTNNTARWAVMNSKEMWKPCVWFVISEFSLKTLGCFFWKRCIFLICHAPCKMLWIWVTSVYEFSMRSVRCGSTICFVKIAGRGQFV